MLANVNLIWDDPIANIVARASGGDEGIKQLRTGVYQIGHFSLELTLRANGYFVKDEYPRFNDYSPSAYGVCDSPEQLFDLHPEIIEDERPFVVSFTEIRKDQQSDWGGWRWHKWGPYIGEQEPTAEYLYDEPMIDVVWVYHIYEVDDGR